MALSKTEKLEQLSRILHSQAFQASDHLRAFLEFVVLKTTEDSGNGSSDLKEYTIATEVFGRDSSYDPRTDSVVRVQAVRLRSKLQEYYATEGKEDKVLIELPKGHYIPYFSYHANSAVVAASSSSSKWYRLGVAGLVIVSIVLAVAVIKYRSEVSRLQASLSSKAADPLTLQVASQVWGDFLKSPEPILVAYSNTLFKATTGTGMELLRPLDSSGQGFGAAALQRTETIGTDVSRIIDHYTGVGEVAGVYSLGNLFWQVGHPFRVKRSLLLTWEDLKTGNAVILGGPAENLLLRELPQHQDFEFQVVTDETQGERYGIVNRRPQKGEQKAYHADLEGPSTNQLLEDYALISMLKGLGANKKLLILAGIKTVGTQAAAEYMSNPKTLAELIAHLNTAPEDRPPKLPPYYQVLLKVKVNGGVPVQISWVTHHILN